MATLEERKRELVGLIGREQDHKLKRARSLIRRYGDELEAAAALVESAIRSMEEPHMSAFIQVGSPGRPGNVRPSYTRVTGWCRDSGYHGDVATVNLSQNLRCVSIRWFDFTVKVSRANKRKIPLFLFEVDIFNFAWKGTKTVLCPVRTPTSSWKGEQLRPAIFDLITLAN